MYWVDPSRGRKDEGFKPFMVTLGSDSVSAAEDEKTFRSTLVISMALADFMAIAYFLLFLC